MIEFYVYQLREEGVEHPFYIGKGKGNRAYQHLNADDGNFNSYKNNTIRRILDGGGKVLVEFLWQGLSESESLRREVWSIKMWGRKDLGEGPLTNLTDGGEGVCGAKIVLTPESLAFRNERIRESKKDPAYIEKIRAISKETNERPEVKKAISEDSKRRWQSDRDKMLASQPAYTEERRQRMRESGSSMSNLQEGRICEVCGNSFKGPSYFMHVKHKHK